MRRVLILKPSSLGDVIQALPVLRLLKRDQPQDQIYWWIETRLAGLLESDPDLEGIIPFDRNGWWRPQGWREAAGTIHEMRERRFDVVIDLQGLFRSAVVAWLANGDFTIGVDDPREGARAFYDRAVPRPSPATHAVEWYVDVVRQLNVPVDRRFTWLPERLQVAKTIRKKWAIDGHRWIVVQPGARWETKRWPAEHFSRAVQRLAQTLPDFRFAIMGAAGDAEMAAEVTHSCRDRCLDLTGKTSLPEMIEWVRACELMLTNDTGPMHVAAALGRPVVAVFGPTNPRRTGPFGQLGNVLQSNLACVPCLQEDCRRPTYLECLWSITPEAVCERVERLLVPGG